ncbi:MAG: hypothetical protein LBT33_02545, partial [Spirochaetia bacterium]|nr:hypothetical protein [Spirochaetia bacterium]
MKKFLFLLLAVCLLAPAGLFANGTENNYNMDAGFLRNPSKNTETKSLNAIFYNPAGTAFMADGLYLGAGNQFVLKEYSHEIGGTTYKADTTTFLYPNAELLYKKDNFAFFSAFGVFAGGGTLEYKDGSATLQP